MSGLFRPVIDRIIETDARIREGLRDSDMTEASAVLVLAQAVNNLAAAQNRIASGMEEDRKKARQCEQKGYFRQEGTEQ